MDLINDFIIMIEIVIFCLYIIYDCIERFFFVSFIILVYVYEIVI